MSLTDCFMFAFMGLCWALSPSSWWCVQVHTCLCGREEIKWHHYCVRLPIRFVLEIKCVFPLLSARNSSLSRRPQHRSERIPSLQIRPGLGCRYWLWLMVNTETQIYEFFYTNRSSLIKVVKRENLADGDSGKDPQYRPLSCLHPTLTHTFVRRSYCFCVIVICVGAEIALLDKSLLGPLDGHCGSREALT